MRYRYYANANYSDFASGRVIYHKSGVPNFPARLAGEIFRRCLEYLGRNEDIVLYDPCCGGGYMLTVLGLLEPDTVRKFVGSDVSAEAIALAHDNLSLLTEAGLLRRMEQIDAMIAKYGKESHVEARYSAQRFLDIIKRRPFEPEIEVFVADILDPDSLERANFKSDIVMVDVPYGNLASWSSRHDDPISSLLHTIAPVIKPDAVVAVSADKGQKICNEDYMRLKRLRVGKRHIEIFTPKR